MRGPPAEPRQYALQFARARADLSTLAKCAIAIGVCVTVAIATHGVAHAIALAFAVTVVSVSLVLGILPAKRLWLLFARRRFGEYDSEHALPSVPYARLTENQFDYTGEPDDPDAVKKDIVQIVVGVVLFAFVAASIRQDMSRTAMLLAQVMGSSLVVMLIRSTHHLFTHALPRRRRNRTGSLPDDA